MSLGQEHHRKLVLVAGAATLVALAVAERGTGQAPKAGFRADFFLHLEAGFPLGDFGSNADWGAGMGVGEVLFARVGWLGLRSEASFLIYGSEIGKDPNPFVDVEQETTNWILAAGWGPQIYLGTGPIRPFAYGTVGFSAFVTTTSLSWIYEDLPIESTINHSDFGWQFHGGGGLSIEVEGGKHPLYINLSASYRYNGWTSYLANGTDNLRRLPDGDWVADPIESDANLMSYSLGLRTGAR